MTDCIGQSLKVECDTVRKAIGGMVTINYVNNGPDALRRDSKAANQNTAFLEGAA
jgi:hypothetical protein